MPPLARPALLAALLLAPIVVRAQIEGDPAADASARMRALNRRYSDGAQRPAEAAAAPAAVEPAKLRASVEEIKKAGIPIATLIDASPHGMNWLPANVADLGPAIEAASKAVFKLHEENPSEVSGMPYGNGSMVNLEDSIKWATGAWGGSQMKRGCVSHQGVTFPAVSAALGNNSSLQVRGVKIYRKVFEHHAVIVFPKGTDWKKTGVVLDGWIHQESAPNRITFLFKDWNGITSWGSQLE